MTLGKPVGAFPSQDHMAHIQTHLDFGTDPMLGASMLMAPKFQPAVVDHIREHISFWYLEQMHKGTKMDVLKAERIPIADQATMARISMNIKNAVSSQLAPVMKDLQPIYQDVLKLLAQQQQQQIPVDPNAQALVQAQMAETQRKAQQDQANNALKAQDMQLISQEKAQGEMTQQQIEAARLQTQVAINDANNIAQERMKGMQLAMDTAKIDAEQQRTVEEETQMLHTMEESKPEPTKEST